MNDSKIRRENLAERLVQIAMAVVVLAVFIVFANGIKTHAAESVDQEVDIVEINYGESTMTIRLDAKDTILFMSNDAQKKWEFVPLAFEKVTETVGGTEKTYNYVTMDISWVSVSKNYTISLKGDYSARPIKVVLPKQITNFKATYDMYNSRVNFTNAGSYTIEWKKKEAFNWQTYEEGDFAKQLENMIDNGASLQFRIAAENGTGDDSDHVGHRASKEVSVTIPKKTAAPKITINDSKLSITLKKGMNYRIVDENGNSTGGDWTTITRDGEIMLESIADAAIYSDDNKDTHDVYVQFYQSATSSSQMSKRKTVKIPAQTPLTEADVGEENTYISYTGKSNFELHFKTAGESNKLEYCIITKDMQELGISINNLLDDNITWNTVSSTEAIAKSKDTDKKLVDGSRIYYRRKAQNSLGDKDYKLASPAVELTRLTYPDGAAKDDLTILRTIEGMCKSGAGNLYFTFTSDTEGKVEKIEFRNTSDSQGTATFKDEVTKIDNIYTHNITITDLSNVKATRSLLYAYIYVAGQENVSPQNAALVSNDETGVALYIYPKTVIDNPVTDDDKTVLANKLKNSDDDSVTEARKTYWSEYTTESDTIGFSTAMKRVYLSNRTEAAAALQDSGISRDMVDQSQYRVVLKLGTLYVPQCTEVTIDDDTDDDGRSVANYIEAYKQSDKVKVTAIKYDNVSLNSSEYFTVEYFNTLKTNAEEYDYRTAVITINADKIERDSRIDDRDKDSNVYIYLSNGEIIKSGITLNLQRTVTAKSNSIAFTEGKLEAYRTTKSTENGVTTETKTRCLDKYYTIELTVPSTLGGKFNYDVGVKTVTWDGVNILYTAEREGNTITVTLDSDLMNQIDVETSKTCDIRIEMTNGYVISNGIPMTVNPAPAVQQPENPTN